MLEKGREIWGGVFDSEVLRRNQAKSQSRIVRYYELELFHTAGGTSHVNGESYPVRRGMLLCAKPGQVRCSDFPVRCSFIRIIPRGDKNGDILALLAALPTCTYLDDEEKTNLLLGLFSSLSAHCIASSPDPASAVRVNSLFLDILYRCMRLCRRETKQAATAPANRTVQNITEYIGEHFLTSDCSLQALSQAMNLSPNYLHVVFKRVTGKTPLAYVTDLRMGLAKRLIMAGEKTMLEIALETGFCSQSHFNKVFKAETGLTPVAYRKQLLDQY